jgi:hypothetical protein
MTILSTSRYAGQTVVRVTSNRGTVPTIFRDPPTLPTRFLHYTVRQGDRFDTLANLFFNDSTQWWGIADANPEVWYPGDLVPGSIIRIPQS